MKQDQSYFGQVFYLREDNFGLNCKKNVCFKIFYKIVALFTENYPSRDLHKDRTYHKSFYRNYKVFPNLNITLKFLQNLRGHDTESSLV